MKKSVFSPLLFLASLGAGGIAIIPFAFLNYSHSHKGALVQLSDITNLSILMYFFFAVMIVFTAIHLFLTIKYVIGLIKWRKSDDYRELMKDPLKNSSIMAPFISILMTMNVFIGPVRFFIKGFAENLEMFMLPALVFWTILWGLTMFTAIKILKNTFSTEFDINKIHFGWLLHPFAIGMLSVVGAGIAALSENSQVAHVAAFMSLTAMSFGIFLLVVKLFSIFMNHFAMKGMPERQFFPGFLIVIPNITLYAITMFRLGHYAEHHLNADLGFFFTAVITLAFAFETWYLLFGFALLKDYFKKHFNKEYYVSQWGLVCPVVAYAVLGSFLYKVFIASPIIYWTVVFTSIVAIVLFFLLLSKMLRCARSKSKLSCF